MFSTLARKLLLRTFPLVLFAALAPTAQAEVGRSAQWKQGPIPKVPNIRARAERPVRLMRPGLSSSFQRSAVPGRAPRALDAAKQLKFPNIKRMFQLDFRPYGNREGGYTGPDGGHVHRWGNGTWIWKRKDGMHVGYWGWAWELGFDKHRIRQSPKRDAKYHESWEFPDGFVIQKNWLGFRRKFNYSFRSVGWRPDHPKVHYHMLGNGHFAPLTRRVGPVLFNYHPRWEDYVAGWLQKDVRRRFFEVAQRAFGFKNHGIIPVYLAGDLREFQHMAHPGATPGGFGGEELVALYLEAHNVPKFSRDPDIRRVQVAAHGYGVLLHEMGHNLAAHSCAAVRRGRKLPKIKMSGWWYIEGVASFLGMKVDPRSRAAAYHGLYRYMDDGNIPADIRNIRKHNAHYAVGAMMLEYISLRWGDRYIRKYNDGICTGLSANTAMQRSIGLTPQQLLTQSVKYFRDNRKSLLRKVAPWRAQGFVRVQPLSAGTSRPLSQDYVPPANFLELRRVPDVFGAYRYDLSRYKGKQFKGDLQFQGSDGARVILSNDPTWDYRTVVGFDTAWIKKDATLVSFKRNGKTYKLHSAPDGHRSLVYPDGSSVSRTPDGKTKFVNRHKQVVKTGKEPGAHPSPGQAADAVGYFTARQCNRCPAGRRNCSDLQQAARLHHAAHDGDRHEGGTGLHSHVPTPGATRAVRQISGDARVPAGRDCQMRMQSPDPEGPQSSLDRYRSSSLAQRKPERHRREHASAH